MKLKYTGKAKGLGGIIQGLRAKRNLTQISLARRSGLTPSHINAIENHQRRLTDEARLKIARALRVSPDALIYPRSVVRDNNGKYKLSISGETTPPFEITLSGDNLQDVLNLGLTAMAALEELDRS